MTHSDDPNPADARFAVSPNDAPSDRAQADANNATAVEAADLAAADRAGMIETAANADETAVGGQAEIMTILRTIRAEGRKIPESNERLATSIDNASTAMVEYQERAKLAKRRYLTTIALIVIGFGGLYIRQEISNANVIEGRDNSRSILNTIADCLDPTGACAQAGERKSAATTARLVDAQLTIAVCTPAGQGIANGVDRKAAIASCMIELGAK